MASDAELIAAVAAGDGHALDGLYRRYERPLYQFLFRRGGAAVRSVPALLDVALSDRAESLSRLASPPAARARRHDDDRAHGRGRGLGAIDGGRRRRRPSPWRASGRPAQRARPALLLRPHGG